LIGFALAAFSAAKTVPQTSKRLTTSNTHEINAFFFAITTPLDFFNISIYAVSRRISNTKMGRFITG
jgi:uncharacterized protein with PQ loop repeat